MIFLQQFEKYCSRHSNPIVKRLYPKIMCCNGLLYGFGEYERKKVFPVNTVCKFAFFYNDCILLRLTYLDPYKCIICYDIINHRANSTNRHISIEFNNGSAYVVRIEL